MKRIRILLADDHAVVRQGFKMILGEQPDMEIVGEAGNGREALQLAESLKPDLVVMDVAMPELNGIEATRRMIDVAPHARVLALSMHKDSVYVREVLRAGARGYITKYEASSEVMAAIEQVLNGHVYLSRQMTSRMLGLFADAKKGDPRDVSALTDRELDVFQRLGRGETARDIASALHVGITTIDTYRARIKEKLGLKNGNELQRRAMEWAQENPA